MQSQVIGPKWFIGNKLGSQQNMVGKSPAGVLDAHRHGGDQLLQSLSCPCIPK